MQPEFIFHSPRRWLWVPQLPPVLWSLSIVNLHREGLRPSLPTRLLQQEGKEGTEEAARANGHVQPQFISQTRCMAQPNCKHMETEAAYLSLRQRPQATRVTVGLLKRNTTYGKAIVRHLRNNAESPRMGRHGRMSHWEKLGACDRLHLYEFCLSHSTLRCSH